MRSLHAGLLGHPVAESLSPLLHQVAGASCGVAVDYRLGDVDPENIVSTMAKWQAEGVHGFNLTAPHKAAGAQWVDRLSPLAARVGAVNTVICHGDGRTEGHNTDVDAFARTVGEAPERVVVFGAGGAVRAVIVALLESGVSCIEVVNRSQQKAQAMADALGPRQIRVYAMDRADHCLDEALLVVNALPAAANHWVCDRQYQRMKPAGRVLDLGYGERVQPIATAVGNAGLRFDSGLEMLARQGVAAFALWTGLTPPLAPVLSALSNALLESL